MHEHVGFLQIRMGVATLRALKTTFPSGFTAVKQWYKPCRNNLTLKVKTVFTCMKM